VALRTHSTSADPALVSPSFIILPFPSPKSVNLSYSTPTSHPIEQTSKMQLFAIIAILVFFTTILAGDRSPSALTCERCSPIDSKIGGMLDNKLVVRTCADSHDSGLCYSVTYRCEDGKCKSRHCRDLGLNRVLTASMVGVENDGAHCEK
jgi:hypothetical protein